MVAIILIAVGFIVGTILALPTALPEIRRRAQRRPRFRNRTRILFAILTLVIVFDGLSWGMSQFYAGIGMCNQRTIITGNNTIRQFNCDTAEDIPRLSLELWLRTTLPPSARDTCFVGTETCDVIAEYNLFTNDNPINTWPVYLGLLAAAVIGMAVNWGVVSFFTQPKKTSSEMRS